MERYFIVVYTLNVAYIQGNTGSRVIEINNGGYPNPKLIAKMAGADNVTILNIIELSKEDYLKYNEL
jgi:hypothetical protein